jgi:hypothetical protein
MVYPMRPERHKAAAKDGSAVRAITSASQPRRVVPSTIVDLVHLLEFKRF